MKLVEIESNVKLEDGDMLIFRGNHFKSISHSAVLRVALDENRKLKQEIYDLSIRIKRIELKLKYDAGEITKEAYENELGLNRSSN